MVYKIRVILDTPEDIFRDIEIKGKQTLWNLHESIRNAFNLQEDELSAFNLLEDDGTVYKSVPLEDMSDDGDGEIMADVYIDEVFTDQGDKAHFQYGLLDLWEFFCELVETSEENSVVTYPHVTYRFGTAPLKAPVKNNATTDKKSGIGFMEGMDDGLYDDFDDDGFNDDEFGEENGFSEDFYDEDDRL